MNGSTLDLRVNTGVRSTSLTNGAGNSMARARRERRRVKIWRIGKSTMIATNGRELAPGLGDQRGFCPGRGVHVHDTSGSQRPAANDQLNYNIGIPWLT